MAERLIKYYNYVGETVGLTGKMKLAQATNIPVSRAAMEPDNIENLDKFRRAVEEIVGEPPPNF